MKKTVLIAIAMLALSLSALAQTIVKAERDSTYADVCYQRNIQLPGYAYANLIGLCSWDPAINGLQLFLIAIPMDPTEEAYKIELANNILFITEVKTIKEQLVISYTEDYITASGGFGRRNGDIYARSVNMKEGTFSVLKK